MQIYCQISFSDIYSLVFFIPKTNVLTSNTHIFTHLHEWRSSDQVRRSHHHTGVQVVVSASWGKFLKDCFNYYSYLLCSFMFFTDINSQNDAIHHYPWPLQRQSWIITLHIFSIHCTLEAQVAHVQDGSQQLGDLPVLSLSEHEDLHGWQDAGVIVQVVATVTRCTSPLQDKTHRDLYLHCFS